MAGLPPHCDGTDTPHESSCGQRPRARSGGGGVAIVATPSRSVLLCGRRRLKYRYSGGALGAALRLRPVFQTAGGDRLVHAATVWTRRVVVGAWKRHARAVRITVRRSPRLVHGAQTVCLARVSVQS